MAKKAFDPIAEGATLDEEFDPLKEGASLIEENEPSKESRVDNRNLLQKAGGEAQKYINAPIEASGLPSLASGFIQGLGNAAKGVGNLGIKAKNLFTKNQTPEFKAYDVAPHNAPAIAGEFASYFGPGMMAKGLGAVNALEVPSHIKNIEHISNAINKVKNMIGKSPQSLQKSVNALSNIGKGAAQGAIFNPEDQGLGAILGGGGSALGMGLSSGVPFGLKKAGLLRGKPGRETLENINYEEVKPTIEAAKRQGIDLTPAEAAGSGYIGGQEGRYLRTSKGAIEGEKSSKERIKQEKGLINSLLNNIYDKSTASDNKISDLYKTAYKWNMKQEVVNKLKSDSLINEAFEKVSKDKVWQRKLEGAPENNFAYLDKVRRSLSDEEGKLLRSGEKSKASEYTDARNTLTEIMDNSSSAYKKARAEAQRKIIRSQVQKKLNTSEIKGSDFYNKIIKNENKFDDLVSSLKNVPEAQQQLRDMKLIFKDLVNPSKPKQTAYQSASSTNQARGSLEKAIQMWDQVFNKERNYESVKFTRNMDKWVSELQEARAKGNKARTESVLSDILGKAFASGLNVAKEGSKE
jgi:hypothetical protein